MNGIIKILFVFVLIVFGFRVESQGGGENFPGSDDVWLLVWQYPMYPGADADADGPSGLVAAVRANGVYYRAISKDDIGSKFLTGTLPSYNLQEMKRMFGKKWVDSLSKKCQYKVLHVSTIRLEIDSGGKKIKAVECNTFDNKQVGDLLNYIWAMPVDKSTAVDIKSEKLPRPSFDLDSSPQR